MFCSQCGNDIPDGSTFCNVCGAKLITPNVGGADMAAPKVEQRNHNVADMELEKMSPQKKRKIIVSIALAAIVLIAIIVVVKTVTSPVSKKHSKTLVAEDVFRETVLNDDKSRNDTRKDIIKRYGKAYMLTHDKLYTSREILLYKAEYKGVVGIISFVFSDDKLIEITWQYYEGMEKDIPDLNYDAEVINLLQTDTTDEEQLFRGIIGIDYSILYIKSDFMQPNMYSSNTNNKNRLWVDLTKVDMGNASGTGSITKSYDDKSGDTDQVNNFTIRYSYFYRESIYNDFSEEKIQEWKEKYAR